VSVVLTPQVSPVTDMKTYDTLGLNLAQGRGYKWLGDQPTAWRVPGYPLLLAGVYKCLGHSTLAARLLQVVIAFATVWVTYRLALAGFGDARAAVWAAALVALCPTTLLFSHLLMTENLFTLLFTAGLLGAFAWRRRNAAFYAAVGAVLGAAALVRPIAAVVALTLPILLWVSRQRLPAVLTRTAAAWLGLALVMSPWWHRNWRVFHTFIPTDLSAGVTFFIGNNEQAGGRSDFSLVWKLVPRVKDELTRDRVARREGLAFIRRHPARFLRILPGKALASWGLDRDGLYAYREGYWGRPRTLGLLALAPFTLGIAVLLPLALVTIFSGRPREPVLWMLWPVFTCWLVAILSAPGARIHAPLVPILAVLAGRCIAERQWQSALRPRRWNFSAVMLWVVIAVVVSYWCWEIVEGAARES